MAVALVSLLKEIPILSHVAMTGGSTLRGRILPVGGIKRRYLRPNGQGLLRLSYQNETKRHGQVPENAKKEMNFIFVEKGR